MMLAFLVDQSSELGCKLYRAAREKRGTKLALWEKMRFIFEFIEMDNWDIIFEIIGKNAKFKISFDST